MLGDCETRLWQSVILTAINDTLISEKAKKNKYQRSNMEDARKWLLHDNNNYFHVCNMANINPNTLRYNIKKALQQTGDKGHFTKVNSLISHNNSYCTDNYLEAA